MHNVRLNGVIGSYTIDKRNGAFITLRDSTGQRISYETWRVCGGEKQNKVKYEYGELKTHVDNVIDYP